MERQLFYFFSFSFIFISWRLITLQYCNGFAIHWYESAMDLHAFTNPIPPPTTLPIPSLWVFPVHQPWALVLCIQPGLVVCFTLESILVSMLFSQHPTLAFSHRVQKSVLYMCVSFSVLHIGLLLSSLWHKSQQDPLWPTSENTGNKSKNKQMGPNYT